jgi:transposase
MPINWETYGEIRALYAQGISDRKIAKALNIGRRTVAKYRDGADFPELQRRNRPAPVRDAVESEIKRMLNENASLPRKQRYNAHDIWDELLRLGLAVSEGHVRRIVHELRAGGDEFIPLQHKMGESLQFDWFDAVAVIAGEKTAVSILVAVLPFSCAVFAFAYPDKKFMSFAHGHVCAFEACQGVVRQCTYDNLRSAVLADYGKNAQKQKEFMRIEKHYGFQSVFCNISAGWEKSNAENGVKITRHKCFIPMPRVDSWRELQNHIDVCLLKYNKTHKISGEPHSIWENMQLERKALIPLPASRMEYVETIPNAKVYHDQTVVYDGVRYSVPHGYVNKKASLRVSPFEVEIYCGGKLLHTHQKALSKGDNQYVLDHYLDALSRKPRAAGQALPVIKGQMPQQCKAFLLTCPAKNAPQQLVSLMLLAREIGPERVLRAMDKALKNGRPTAEIVKLYINMEDAPGGDIEVRHAQLAIYDMLVVGDGEGSGGV